MQDFVPNRSVGYVPGAHGNFLVLTLNLCYNHAINRDGIEYQIKSKNYDKVVFPKDCATPYFDLHEHRLSHYINIKVDNEIVWLHQMICRSHYHNHHINDYEKKFLKKSKSNPVLKKTLKKIPMEIKQNWNRDTLKWFYKNKIFGKVLKDWPVNNKPHRYTVPFSAFYEFDKFAQHVTHLEPTAPINLLKTLYKDFHHNLIHNDKNIAHTGSILYESWQEHIHDR